MAKKEPSKFTVNPDIYKHIEQLQQYKYAPAKSYIERSCDFIIATLGDVHNVIVEYQVSPPGVAGVVFRARGQGECTIDMSAFGSAAIDTLVYMVERGLKLVDKRPEAKAEAKKVKLGSTESWVDKWVKNNGGKNATRQR